MPAMAEFFERPVLGGRIGNDLEPMLFYGDTAAESCLGLTHSWPDPDPTIRRLALEALVTVRGDRKWSWPGPSHAGLAIRTRRCAPGQPRQ